MKIQVSSVALVRYIYNQEERLEFTVVDNSEVESLKEAYKEEYGLHYLKTWIDGEEEVRVYSSAQEPDYGDIYHFRVQVHNLHYIGHD